MGLHGVEDAKSVCHGGNDKLRDLIIGVLIGFAAYAVFWLYLQDRRIGELERIVDHHQHWMEWSYGGVK